MKPHLFMTRSISYLMIIVFAAACSKEGPQVKPCDPCGQPPPPPKTYTVNDNNWTNTSPLKFQSDLNEVLKTYVGSYHLITSVSLMSYINGDYSTGLDGQELIPGNAVPLADGELTFTGNLLIYNEKIVNGHAPILPFNSLILKITVK